jgi:lipoprotein NlpD
MMLGCASNPHHGATTYVVRPQDTLYSIAWRHDLDYRDLARWNNIRSDTRLAVGQVLVLQPDGRSAAPPSSTGVAPAALAPQSGAASLHPDLPRIGKPVPLGEALSATAPQPRERAAGAAAPNAIAAPGGIAAPNHTVTNGAAVRAPPSGPGAGALAAEPLAPAVGGKSKWVWPTDRLSPPRPVPGGGVLLLGRLGQDVRAAGSGRVVYTGSGLRGYGNLIIIKHGETLLSSYAHNRELLVHEGQDVAAGQVIAHMGTGPHQISALYFEIRVNGKPTDPLRYLAQ